LGRRRGFSPGGTSTRGSPTRSENDTRDWDRLRRHVDRRVLFWRCRSGRSREASPRTRLASRAARGGADGFEA
jgi:hypothetical protein